MKHPIEDNGDDGKITGLFCSCNRWYWCRSPVPLFFPFIYFDQWLTFFSPANKNASCPWDHGKPFIMQCKMSRLQMSGGEIKHFVLLSSNNQQHPYGEHCLSFCLLLRIGMIIDTSDAECFWIMENFK